METLGDLPFPFVGEKRRAIPVARATLRAILLRGAPGKGES